MPRTHPKRRFLEEIGALHRRPEDVRAEIFERDRFFDPQLACGLGAVLLRVELFRPQRAPVLHRRVQSRSVPQRPGQVGAAQVRALQIRAV